MTAAGQAGRDPDGADVVAWAQTLGLRGFSEPRSRQPAKFARTDPAPAGKNEDGANVIELVEMLGLRGFAKASDFTATTEISALSEADGGDVVTLVRDIGLRGFTPAPAVSSTAKDAASVATSPPPAAARPAVTVAPVIAAKAPPAVTPPMADTPGASKLSKARFLQISVAPGGHAAMAALEGKLGMPITGAQSQKLTRSVAGGGEVRAFLLPGDVDSEAKISDVLGQLGNPALTASMGPIDLSQFAMTGGRGGKPWPPQLRSGVISALRRVLKS